MNSKVTLIDSMGNDLSIVNAARVSFDKVSELEEVGPEHSDEYGGPVWRLQLKDKDKRLINYLAKHQHWTPFSQVQLQFRIRMPIFVARQWYKHMVGFTRNEVSRRYVSDTPEIWSPTGWRLAAKDKKQGSSDEICSYSDVWTEAYERFTQFCVTTYEEMIENNICPEQARAILPQGMYTEFIETGSLAAYARLYNLRSQPDAQKEIQDYAVAIGEQCAKIAPVSWEALTNG